jgi:hypothetical protein
VNGMAVGRRWSERAGYGGWGATSTRGSRSGRAKQEKEEDSDDNFVFSSGLLFTDDIYEIKFVI